MWRERERERGYSNFRSRDKRSVLTRCSSNKQAESFSISSEKRGKRIEEVDVDPRAACTQSRPILAVTLLGKFGGEDNAWNTPREHDTPLEGSKNRCIASLDCRQLWYTDEWEGMLGANICVYPRALLGVEPRKSAQGSRKGSTAEQFSPFPFFPRIRLNERSAIPSTNLVQPISQSEIPFNAIDTSRFICTKQRTFPRPWGEDPR